MKNPLSSSRGFTLIELLVVISIIAILSGIIITSLTGSKAKARDAQRVSDLSQIQLAIEQYFDRCQQYPVPANGFQFGWLTADFHSGSCTSNGATITLGNFISKIPKDPSSGLDYGYVVNTTPSPTDYILYAALETNSAALQDSIPPSGRPAWANGSTGGIDINCYSGSLNDDGKYDYCIGSK